MGLHHLLLIEDETDHIHKRFPTNSTESTCIDCIETKDCLELWWPNAAIAIGMNVD